ncbi:MAG: hypothetical protein ACOY3Y_08645 [Acidobacteriota bacterium]
MLRKISFALLAVGALALVACGDDTKPVTKKDTGGIKLPDSGTNPTPDTGTNPTPDTGTVTPGKEAGTTPTAGFGASCSQTKPCADTSMMCAVVQQGATTGFCTKECTNQGGECTGAPTGTHAFCILSDQTKTKFYCAFLCSAKDQSGQVATWPCPTDLKCDTVENPAGSGQKACIP